MWVWLVGRSVARQFSSPLSVFLLNFIQRTNFYAFEKIEKQNRTDRARSSDRLKWGKKRRKKTSNNKDSNRHLQRKKEHKNIIIDRIPLERRKESSDLFFVVCVFTVIIIILPWVRFYNIFSSLSTSLASCVYLSCCPCMYCNLRFFSAVFDEQMNRRDKITTTATSVVYVQNEIYITIGRFHSVLKSVFSQSFLVKIVIIGMECHQKARTCAHASLSTQTQTYSKLGARVRCGVCVCVCLNFSAIYHF